MPDDNIFTRMVDHTLKGTQRVIHSSDILPNTIKQRHLESNAWIIFTGLAADRPDGSSHVRAYFATDTFVLSIWTGSAWKSVTLS